MDKKSEESKVCGSDCINEPSCCNDSKCRVESLITVDERGQMVLPKEVRDKADIKAGDKLALISWTMNGKVLCFSLMKSEELGFFVKDYLGPVMKSSSKK